MDLQIIFYIAILVMSAVIHEYMHGFVAFLLGDNTAQREGRLTLNPIAHVDMFGTILLPLALYFFSGGNFLFAYAKPVPFNPYNLKYPRWGPAMVGLAGPGINLLIAVVFGLAVRTLGATPIGEFFAIITWTNIVLAVFNLVPIPPLDGSKLLYGIFLHANTRLVETLERYGTWLFILFIFFGFSYITPIMDWLFQLITGASRF
ncbi:MAG: site-2 protease family protein [bacterium]|nr:site-2 protease family protein [bacterium]